MDLRTWNEASRTWGRTPAQKDAYERGARSIVTVWGNTTHLTDYASRQWAGLVKSYYKPRWMLFADDLIAAVEDGRDFNEKDFDGKIRFFELGWTDPARTPIDYTAPGDPVALSRQIIGKYGF